MLVKVGVGAPQHQAMSPWRNACTWQPTVRATAGGLQQAEVQQVIQTAGPLICATSNFHQLLNRDCKVLLYVSLRRSLAYKRALCIYHTPHVALVSTTASWDGACVGDESNLSCHAKAGRTICHDKIAHLQARY